MSAEPQPATAPEPAGGGGLARLRNWRDSGSARSTSATTGSSSSSSAMFVYFSFSVAGLPDHGQPAQPRLPERGGRHRRVRRDARRSSAGTSTSRSAAIYVLSEVLAAWAAVHWDIWLALPGRARAGAAMGLINGLLVTKLRVNAFLATLASGTRLLRHRQGDQRRPGDLPGALITAARSTTRTSGRSSARTRWAACSTP